MRNYIMAAVVGGVVVGLVVALVFLVLGNAPRSALSPAPPKAAAGSSGGGPDAEKMMDQCTAMMQETHNMMPGSGTGMMGGQDGNSMQDMMRRRIPQSGL